MDKDSLDLIRFDLITSGPPPLDLACFEHLIISP